MRTLPKPSFSTGEVLLKCISNYSDTELLNRFTNSKEEIVDWSNFLEEKINNNEVYTIEEGVTPREITDTEMVKVYKDKFSKQKQPGRTYYDKLMNLPINDMCPICGYRTVDSLDHYLPKEKYPIFSISPINLIPTCMGCNKKKFSDAPTRPEEEYIHPYFDNIENDLWLYAEIIEELPISVLYKVKPHNSWDDVMSERVTKHFKRFKLGQLYSSYASEELSGKIFSLKQSFEQGGTSVVKRELQKEVESLRFSHVNSWKTALYTALYESDWFCEVALDYSIEKILM
ncbi:hypothetical protein [Sediminibacillus sp. JSM 1682029]|uniref:hypothetical protein n=1 Tax=Sediminibacillus sp. JSM 1682029 TaxID=3229857 RepID=UPI0035247C72